MHADVVVNYEECVTVMLDGEEPSLDPQISASIDALIDAICREDPVTVIDAIDLMSEMPNTLAVGESAQRIVSSITSGAVLEAVLRLGLIEWAVDTRPTRDDLEVLAGQATARMLRWWPFPEQLSTTDRLTEVLVDLCSTNLASGTKLLGGVTWNDLLQGKVSRVDVSLAVLDLGVLLETLCAQRQGLREGAVPWVTLEEVEQEEGVAFPRDRWVWHLLDSLLMLTAIRVPPARIRIGELG